MSVCYFFGKNVIDDVIIINESLIMICLLENHIRIYIVRKYIFVVVRMIFSIVDAVDCWSHAATKIMLDEFEKCENYSNAHFFENPNFSWNDVGNKPSFHFTFICLPYLLYFILNICPFGFVHSLPMNSWENICFVLYSCALCMHIYKTHTKTKNVE